MAKAASAMIWESCEIAGIALLRTVSATISAMYVPPTTRKATAPTVSQKEETVGSFLTIVPDAQDDGQILLSVSYDNTVAQPLKTLSFGSGNNEIKLQQKTVDGIGTVQQLQARYLTIMPSL